MYIPLLLPFIIPLVLSVAFTCIQIRWPHLKLAVSSDALHNLMADVIRRLPDLATAAGYLHRQALHFAQIISGTISKHATNNSKDLAAVLNRLDRLEVAMATKVSAMDHTLWCLVITEKLNAGVSQRVSDLNTTRSLFQSLQDLTKETSLALNRLDELEADIPRQIADAIERQAADTAQRLLDAARSTSAEFQDVNGQVAQLRRDLATAANGQLEKSALRAVGERMELANSRSKEVVELRRSVENVASRGEACSGCKKQIQVLAEALTARESQVTKLQGRVQNLSLRVFHMLAKSKIQSENVVADVESAVARIATILCSMERVDDHVLNMTNNLFKVVVALREDVDAMNVRV
ncbi:hypothetical protein C8R44DRAFT_901664 [Mycena epipterygia]|nr:hypothetical protein C8R44DRAFT_901664 [Mycena epipterygia]